MADPTPWWWVVPAAGATGVLAGAVVNQWWTGRREKNSGSKRQRAEAYADLSGQTWAFLMSANLALTIRQNRSGVIDRVETFLRLRTPVDDLRLWQAITEELNRVMKAWSAVLAVGSQDAIDTGTDLINAAEAVFALATVPGQGNRTQAHFLGEKWTPEQLVQFQLAHKRLGAVWNLFVKKTRQELKRKPILLPFEKNLGGTRPRSRWRKGWDWMLRRRVRDVEVDLVPFSLTEPDPTQAGAASGPGTTRLPLPESWLPLPLPPATTPDRLPAAPARPAQRHRRR